MVEVGGLGVEYQPLKVLEQQDKVILEEMETLTLALGLEKVEVVAPVKLGQLQFKVHLHRSGLLVVGVV